MKWISGNGLDLWLIWSANFDGCASGLQCTAGYGFNYQRIHLTLAHGQTHAARVSRTGGTARPPRQWRKLPATPPAVQLPRLHLARPEPLLSLDPRSAWQLVVAPSTRATADGWLSPG